MVKSIDTIELEAYIGHDILCINLSCNDMWMNMEQSLAEAHTATQLACKQSKSIDNAKRKRIW